MDWKIFFKELSVIEIPFHTLETAYWHPISAKLKDKYKNNDNEKRYLQLRKLWFNQEAWWNISFINILLAFSYIGRTSILNKLLKDNIVLHNPKLYSLRSNKMQQKYIGVPDLIIKDDNFNMITFEIKIGKRINSHKYSFQQYSKYMFLSALCMSSTHSYMPNNCYHIVILPNLTILKQISDPHIWNPVLEDNLLRPNINFPNSHSKSKDIWLNKLHKYLLSEKNSVNEIDKSKVYNNIDLSPSYVYDWDTITNTLKDVSNKTDQHLTKSLEYYKNMS